MRLLLILAMGLIVAGCATSGNDKPVQLEDSVMLNSDVYKIGVGDGLSVSVWRNPELSVNVPVRPDGNISVPLIGDINAAGMEPEQLAQEISKNLERYIKSPNVTVVVTDAASSTFLHRVRVTGAVAAPTSVAYSKGMTVMDLVLVTGGLNEFANGNKTKLYRTTASGVKAYDVMLDDILDKGDITTNYTLQPGDIVTVPERMF